MDLTLLRHGDKDYLEDRLVNRAEPTLRTMTRAILADAITQTPFYVVSSPRSRTRQTRDRIGTLLSAKGLDVRNLKPAGIDADLDSVIVDLPRWTQFKKEYRKTHPDLDPDIEMEKPWLQGKPVENWESFTSTQRRMFRFIRKTEKRYGSGRLAPSARVLAFTHGPSLSVILCAILDQQKIPWNFGIISKIGEQIRIVSPPGKKGTKATLYWPKRQIHFDPAVWQQ